MSELTVRMGENIRIYRRANRMTLSELATKINKSKATVGKYEQGTIALDRRRRRGSHGSRASGGICTCTTAGPAGSSAASWSRARRTTP